MKCGNTKEKYAKIVVILMYSVQIVGDELVVYSMGNYILPHLQ